MPEPSDAEPTAPRITVAWSTTDNAIARIASDGLVTATGVGSVTITATTADGGYTSSCLVTVSAPAIAVTGVTLNKASASLTVGDSEHLVATIHPAEATNQTAT